MKKVSLQLSYRADVDGLRAIAVVAVIMFHFFPNFLKGGFAGVDVFFVISGYLVTSIIYTSLSKDTFSFLIFYKKRIKRLFPSLIIVLSFCLIVGWITLLSNEFSLLSKHVFAGSAFFSNFLLLSESGYFDKTSDLKPLLHLWSLCIEEQFYLFWPILLWSFRKNFNFLIKALIAIFTISLILNLKLVKSHPDFTFYMLPTRLWELAFGGLLPFYEIAKDKIIKFKWISPFKRDWSPLGIVLIALSFILLSEGKAYPGKYAILPVFGTGFLLLSTHTATVNRFLTNKPLVYIGLISYPLYLWHYPLISFANIIFSGEVPLLVKVSLLLISFFLACFTYEFLEKPIRHKPESNKIALIICTLLFVVGMSGLLTSLRKSPTSLHLKTEEERSSSNPFRASIDTKESKECIKRFIKIEMCAISSINQNPTIALVGDSHANHLYPGLTKIFKQKGENLLLLAKSGTPPLVGVISKRNPDSSLEDAFDLVLNNPTIHTIILSAFWGSYYNKEGVHVSNYIYKNNIADNLFPKEINQGKIFEQSLIRTIKKIQSSGKKLILFYDVPSLPFHLEQCLPRPFKKRQIDCTFSTEIEKTRNDYKHAFEVALKQKNNIEVFDLEKSICDVQKCSIYKNGIFLYSDDHHLSTQGSILLIKELNI